MIRVEPVGFGEGTTGGAGATPVLVSTWADLERLAGSAEPAVLLLAEGIHDFRRKGSDVADIEVCPSACAEDAEKTFYQVLTGDATCASPLVGATRDDRILRFGSNKTLVGLGRGAALPVTMALDESQNVIIRNLALYDLNPLQGLDRSHDRQVDQRRLHRHPRGHERGRLLCPLRREQRGGVRRPRALGLHDHRLRGDDAPLSLQLQRLDGHRAPLGRPWLEPLPRRERRSR
ncbi:hypothetical protein BE20_00565 [Sorangium cellulosum]|nr:hypothetical protein BE20_00565 [Sorangium cellulosum]